MNSISVSGKNWICKEFNSDDINFIKTNYFLDEIVAKLLSIRKIKKGDIKSFLYPAIKNTLPNPYVLKDMDIADFNPTVDTPIQTLEQLQVDKLNSRINKNDKDEPDGIQPYIAPITLEVDTEFAQGQGLGVNMRSALDKIRANQARRNGSVATGNIQDNQIMMANRGGLAGLFRVKNQ